MTNINYYLNNEKASLPKFPALGRNTKFEFEFINYDYLNAREGGRKTFPLSQQFTNRNEHEACDLFYNGLTNYYCIITQEIVPMI